MSPLPHFANGDPLGAAEANLIARQGVITVETTLDRDNLPAPHEGMVCFVEADNTYYGRVGGEWVVLWSDTGWVNVSLASDWTVQGGGTPQVRRIGKLVYMRGTVRPTSGNVPSGASMVGTIPVGFRPAPWMYYTIPASSPNTSIRLIVKSTGELETAASNTNATYVVLSTPPWAID